MTGVSVRLIDILLSAAEQRGFDAEAWQHELGISPQTRRHPFARVDWDVIAALCDRIAAELESDDAAIDFGESIAPSDNMGVFRMLGRAITDPLDMYEIGARWLGPSVRATKRSAAPSAS